MSSGPATRPIADFTVNIPRPRDVTEIVQSPHYLDLHRQIWDILKKEVLASYERGKTVTAA
jgi:NitT/TauT family transport system ATP-binding protein